MKVMIRILDHNSFWQITTRGAVRVWRCLTPGFDNLPPVGYLTISRTTIRSFLFIYLFTACVLFISRNSPGNNKTARRLISPPTVSQAAKNEKYAISRLSDEAFFTPRTHITHPSRCGGRRRRPNPTYYRVRIPQHPRRRRTACHVEFSDPHHIYIYMTQVSPPSPPPLQLKHIQVIYYEGSHSEANSLSTAA